MADTILISLQVNMRGATKIDDLNRSLLTLRKTVQGLARGLGGSNSAITSATKAVNNTAKAYQNVARSASQTAREEARAARERERQAARTARSIAGTDRNMARQFAQLQRQQVAAATRTATQRIAAERRVAAEAARSARQQERAAQRIADLNAQIPKGLHNLANRMRVVQVGFDAIFRAGYRVQEVGRDMMQMGQRAIGVMSDLTKEFGEFEFMVNRATGAMGLNHDATEDGVNIYERFKQRILETSRELRLFKPEEVARGVYFWASATGQQVDSMEDLEAVLKSVTPLMKVAAMTQTDYETAIKGVYAITIQYGMRLSDVGRVTEKLHQVTQRTAAEFPDLINSFKMVGPVAAANNVTFEDVANVLGRLADAGIRGTMSGRGLRQFFIQTVRPSQIAKDALDALWESTPAFMGKTFEEMIFPGGKFVGIDKYVNTLARALRNATDAQRNFYLARITTANELPILTALVGKEIDVLNGVSTGWDKTKEASEKAAEGFRQSWDKLANSWLGVVGAFEQGLASIRIIVGGQIANVMAPVIEQFTTLLETIIDWAEDPRHQAVIQFFVKGAIAISGFLAAAGGLMLFVGSMTNLGAAIMVVAKAFGPLILKATAFGGAVGLVATVVARNFDYISEKVGEAIGILEEAFGGKGRGIDAMRSSFTSFFDAILPMFDAFVRAAADLVVILAKVVKALMDFGPTAAILTTAAQAMAVIFAAKMIGNILGVGKALAAYTKIHKAFIATTMVAGGGAKATYGPLRGVAKDAGMAARGMNLLKGSFSGIMGFLGPGGVFALIAAGLFMIYENSPEAKKAIDSVFDVIIDRSGEVKERVAELVESMGAIGEQAKVQLQMTSEYLGLVEATRKANLVYLEKQKPGNLAWDLSGAQQAYERAAIAQQEFIENHFMAVDKIVNDLGGQLGITSDEVWAKVFSMQGERGGTIDLAIARTRVFYDEQLREMQNFDSQATSIMAKIKAGTGGADVGGKWVFGKDATGPLLASLVTLRGKTSPLIAEQISQMLSDAGDQGIPIGLEDIEGTMDAEAPKMWKGVGESLIAGAKELRDLDKRIKDAIKNAIKPGTQAKELTKSIVTWTKQGFKNAKGQFVPEAVMILQGDLQDFVGRVEEYSHTMPPAKFTKFIENTLTRFKEDFGPVWSKMPPALKTEVLEQMKVLYGYLGIEEIPQSVLDELNGKGEKAGKEVTKGAKEGAKKGEPQLKRDFFSVAQNAASNFKVGKKPFEEGEKVPKNFGKGMDKHRGKVKTAASKVATAAKPHPGNSFQWGSHMTENFAAGIRAQKAINALTGALNFIAGIVQAILGHSVPKEGPLSDDDQWGYHFAQNIANGIRAGAPLVAGEVNRLANMMAMETFESMNQGVSFESSASRAIKVQVEVTSPDGSVDRVKASQLERGIMTNDLILAIEHMSTVG